VSTLNLKVTKTPALLPDPDPNTGYHYLDPDNYKFEFTHMAGGMLFRGPWLYGNDQRVAQMRKQIEADSGLNLEARK
jgi:hypothetical protein